MITRLIKTAKYMADWVGWTLMYPFLQTEAGQRRVIDLGVEVARRRPEDAQKLRERVESFIQHFFAEVERVEAEAREETRVGAPTIASDVSGRHAPPKPPAPPRMPHVVRRDITGLKERLGLKRS